MADIYLGETLATTAKQTFIGTPIQQTWSAMYMLEKVILENPIMRIVELGTGFGALTRFFGLHMQRRGGAVLSYDIENKVLADWRGLPIGFQVRNVFDLSTVQGVEIFIHSHLSLIFCDNGEKRKELPLYASILKRGDLIMAHDYGEQGEAWAEITPKDIEGTRSILQPYRHQEFLALKTRIICLRRI